MWKLFIYFVIAILLLIATNVFFMNERFRGRENSTEVDIDKSRELYGAAEKASTVAMRTENFNQALSILLALEKKYPKASGELYYNIGNCYYQLQEYPLAVYYYYYAVKLMPESDQTRHNLNLTLTKMGLPLYQSNIASLFERAVNYRWVIAFNALLFLIVIGSILVWSREKKLNFLIGLGVLFLLIALVAILYVNFLEKSEGVLLKAAFLRRDAGEAYAKIGNEPLPAGTKAELLDIRDNGHWIKILTEQGITGYLPQENVRLLP